MENEQNQSLGKDRLLSAFKGKKAVVAGDVMLDRFVYGHVRRLSPEAPVPVLTLDRETRMPGGAGNVLANLSALGVNTRIIGLIGDDADGEILKALLEKLPHITASLVKDSSRPTTVKTRFVNGQTHLMRADSEKTHAAPDDIQKEILAAADAALKGADIFVLSDYAKGALTHGMAQKLIARAQGHGVKIIADPKGRDFTIYRGASIITPNRKELAGATGAENAVSDDEIVSAARQVIEKTGIETVIVTRSEDGMSVIEKDKPPLHIPACAAHVADVSGAGDTVIATLAASLAAGADIADAARLASIAAGIAVGKSGTACVSAQELADAPATPQAKIPAVPAKGKWADAAAQVRQWQAQGLKVGFTNGCFDILHFGHVTYLAQAREKCDRLVVGLNADSSVRRLKGPARPLHDERSRAAVMDALACVDLVVLFGEDAGEKDMPCDVIAALKPDIHFKGGDYTEDQLPEAATVRAYGGDVCIMPLQEGHSTTSTIRKMKSS